jgi:hypothetical protein
MASRKQLVVIPALIAAIAGSSSIANAQGFRGRRMIVAPRVVVGGYYADPYWLYDPWFGYGYYDPFGPYPYPPYRYHAFDPGAAVRLEVKPDNAEVYVDGYYAGIVDDFDSMFQRLRLPPGEHEIALHLDGYRGVKQKVYLTPRNTFRVKYTMERLAPGDQPDERPQPINPPPAGTQTYAPPPGRGPAGPPPQGPPQGPRGGPMGPPRGDASTYGRLAIRVQPADAEILIDGETWRSSDTQDRLIIEVAEGPHTVEIRKAGYRPYVTQVNVRRGESTPLNVSLRSQEERAIELRK